MAAPKPIQNTDLQKETVAEVHTVPQPHGGSLIPGGRPDNAGGLGVAPSYVRERCRRSFLTLVPQLEKIASNPKSHDRDVIRAIDALGRYGLLTGRLDIQEVQVCLQRTLAEIERQLPPDQAARLLKALEPIWNPTQ